MRRNLFLCLHTPEHGGEEDVPVACLVDSGALGTFVSPSFVRQSRLKQSFLSSPITIYDVAGRPLDVTKTFVRARLALGDDPLHSHVDEGDLLVCNVGSFDVILGLPWLVKHDATVSWSTGLIDFARCPQKCASSPAPRVTGITSNSSLDYSVSSFRFPVPTPPPSIAAISTDSISVVSLDIFNEDLEDAAVTGSMQGFDSRNLLLLA
ncbi:hypothetical protein JCM11641_006342 [Rhodosporidiobolus odoratus]